jgi:hypothetical protein
MNSNGMATDISILNTSHQIFSLASSNSAKKKGQKSKIINVTTGGAGNNVIMNTGGRAASNQIHN